MKLSRKITPKGTRHKIPTQTPGGLTTPIYKVTRIIGDRPFVPSSDILVELAFDWVKSTNHYSPFLIISLDTLASDGIPVTEADFFWEQTKTVAK